jgi:dihydrofolate synthase/folylpolyglutamate synthase
VDAAAMAAVVVAGRLELRGSTPLEIWDGAHNPAGMRRLVSELPALVGDRRVVSVFSTLGEKDVAAMVKSLRSVADDVIATESSNSRVMPAAELARITGGVSIADPVAARAAATDAAGPNGAVLICGSLYLLHDLNEKLGTASNHTLVNIRKGT